MCYCNLEVNNLDFCMKGNCTPFERTKQIELQQLKNQAYLISEMENSRFCDLEFANWNWYKRDVQWEIFLKKCKKLGLSVIDTKELRKLENFQAKIDTAVRDYPNY